MESAKPALKTPSIMLLLTFVEKAHTSAHQTKNTMKRKRFVNVQKAHLSTLEARVSPAIYLTTGPTIPNSVFPAPKVKSTNTKKRSAKPVLPKNQSLSSISVDPVPQASSLTQQPINASKEKCVNPPMSTAAKKENVSVPDNSHLMTVKSVWPVTCHNIGIMMKSSANPAQKEQLTTREEENATSVPNKSPF